MSGRGAQADEPGEAGEKGVAEPGVQSEGASPRTTPRPAPREMQSPGEDRGQWTWHRAAGDGAAGDGVL